METKTKTTFEESFVFFQTNCGDFESRLAAECDALIAAIRWRQQQLVASVRRERALKQQAFRDQVTQCTAKLHKTTGLLQYSVEVMKETDPTAFLQVSFCKSIQPPPSLSRRMGQFQHLETTSLFTDMFRIVLAIAHVVHQAERCPNEWLSRS